MKITEYGKLHKICCQTCHDYVEFIGCHKLLHHPRSFSALLSIKDYNFFLFTIA